MNWKQLLVTTVSLIVIAAYGAHLLHCLRTGELWVSPQYPHGYYLKYAHNHSEFEFRLETDVGTIAICAIGLVVIWTI